LEENKENPLNSQCKCHQKDIEISKLKAELCEANAVIEKLKNEISELKSKNLTMQISKPIENKIKEKEDRKNLVNNIASGLKPQQKVTISKPADNSMDIKVSPNKNYEEEYFMPDFGDSGSRPGSLAKKRKFEMSSTLNTKPILKKLENEIPEDALECMLENVGKLNSEMQNLSKNNLQKDSIFI